MTPLSETNTYECARPLSLVKAQKKYRMKRGQAVIMAEQKYRNKISKNITNIIKQRLLNIMRKPKTIEM